MNAIILLVATKTIGMNPSAGYVTGAVIALFILGYLLFSLVKPDKF
ncbi:MAG: hypothetical protein M0Q38_16240 [Bacteroidales bacterium]|jgi:K+-transporting ATPase KdpF subunit|nr:hypothetical protein [Bacteroidales bacterium]